MFRLKYNANITNNCDTHLIKDYDTYIIKDSDETYKNTATHVSIIPVSVPYVSISCISECVHNLLEYPVMLAMIQAIESRIDIEVICDTCEYENSNNKIYHSCPLAHRYHI